MILHGNCMELNYIQEYLNKNLTTSIYGNFVHIWINLIQDLQKNMPLSQFFPANNSPLPYFSPRSHGHFSWIQVSPSNNWNLLCKSSSCSSGLMVGLAIGPAIGLAAATCEMNIFCRIGYGQKLEPLDSQKRPKIVMFNVESSFFKVQQF